MCWVPGNWDWSHCCCSMNPSTIIFSKQSEVILQVKRSKFNVGFNTGLKICITQSINNYPSWPAGSHHNFLCWQVYLMYEWPLRVFVGTPVSFFFFMCWRLCLTYTDSSTCMANSIWVCHASQNSGNLWRSRLGMCTWTWMDAFLKRCL